MHALCMPATPPTRLLIFDCDGVLVDSERLAHEVLVEMRAEQGLVVSLEPSFASAPWPIFRACPSGSPRALETASNAAI